MDTNDAFALGLACAALSEVDIVFDVVPIADVPEALKAREPKSWTRPSRILVSKDDEVEARGVVQPFLEPTVVEVTNEDVARDCQSAGGEGVLDRLFLPHPTPVQRIGCSLIFAVPGVFGLVLLSSTYGGRSLFGTFIALTLIAVTVFGVVRSCR